MNTKTQPMTTRKNFVFVFLLLISPQIASGQNKIFAFWQNMPEPEHRLVAGIHAGGGYLMATAVSNDNSMIKKGISASQANDFNKKLKYGWTAGGDIHYMFSDYIGVGAQYSLFSSSAQKDFLATIQPVSAISQYVHVGMNEMQYIHYAGPSVIFYRRWFDENKTFQLTGALSAGYVHYRKETRIDPTQYTAFYYSLNRGNTWGANAGVSVEYFPLSRLSVGINAGFNYARLTQVNEQTNDETTRTVESRKIDYSQSLARLDYSLIIRFHLYNPKNKEQ